MKKVVRITENDITRLVRETLNEISLGAIKGVEGPDNRIYDAIATIEGELDRYGAGYGNPGANASYTAARKGLEAVKSYFEKKESQAGYMGDVAFSASNMRDGEDDDGQITGAEYADADNRIADRREAASINKAVEDAVRGKGFPMIPNSMLPKVTNYHGDTLEIEMHKSYDKLSNIVRDTMGGLGFKQSGQASRGNMTVMNFDKA